MCTYRTRRWPKIPYHLVRVTDLEFKPQFLITLNPYNQTVEFSQPNYEGRLQTLVFPYPEVNEKLTILTVTKIDSFLGFRQKLAQTSFWSIQRSSDSLHRLQENWTAIH